MPNNTYTRFSIIGFAASETGGVNLDSVAVSKKVVNDSRTGKNILITFTYTIKIDISENFN